MKFVPSFVSILRNLKYVTMNIFGVRKHFLQARRKFWSVWCCYVYW